MHLPEIEKAVVCTHSRVPVACLLVRSVNLLAFPCKMNCLHSGLSGEQRRLLWHLQKEKKKKEGAVSDCLPLGGHIVCVPASVSVEQTCLQPNMRS